MEKPLQTVFVIDQVEFICTLIHLALNEEGIYTFEYQDLDCFHYLEDLDPTLLLIDLKTLSGQEEDFFAKLKERKITKPVFALGWPEEWENSSFQDYFQGFLPKPIKPLEIREQVTQLLNI